MKVIALLLFYLCLIVSGPAEPINRQRPTEYYVKKPVKYEITNDTKVFLDGKRYDKWPPPTNCYITSIEVDGNQVIQLELKTGNPDDD